MTVPARKIIADRLSEFHRPAQARHNREQTDLLPPAFLSVISQTERVMTVEEVVYSYIQGLPALFVLVELQATSQIHPDVGGHLKVVDRGEILQWNLIRLPDQEALKIT